MIEIIIFPIAILFLLWSLYVDDCDNDDYDNSH